MGGARALIATLGASLSLVAGAALSLLVVSFVFAYDGLTGDGYDGAGANGQVVVADLPTTTSKARQGVARTAGAVVIAAPVVRPAAARRPASRIARGSAGAVEARTPAVDRTVITPLSDPPATSGGDPQAPAAPDGVRELGDTATSKVGATGATATGVAEPLGPPVTAAVQEIINLLNGLIQGATGGLTGALDGTAKR